MTTPDEARVKPTSNSVDIPDEEDVIRIALDHLHAPYKIGTEGPDQFDCSGLIDYCFREAGIYDLIGAQRKRARGYWNFFNRQGLTYSNIISALRGDLICYGSPEEVTHIGIYLGGRHQRVVSALINPFGVTKTRYNGLVNEHGKPLPVVGFCRVGYATP